MTRERDEADPDCLDDSDAQIGTRKNAGIFRVSDATEATTYAGGVERTPPLMVAPPPFPLPQAENNSITRTADARLNLRMTMVVPFAGSCDDHYPAIPEQRVVFENIRRALLSEPGLPALHTSIR